MFRAPFGEETANGHVHHDADATSVEALKENGEVLSTQPDRKPKPGEDVAHLAENRLAQWWNTVNPKAMDIVKPAGNWVASISEDRRNYTPQAGFEKKMQAKIDEIKR